MQGSVPGGSWGVVRIGRAQGELEKDDSIAAAAGAATEEYVTGARLRGAAHHARGPTSSCAGFQRERIFHASSRISKAALRFSPGSRLLIVDDGSQDDTAAIVDRYSALSLPRSIRLGRNKVRARIPRRLRRRAGACDGEALVVTLEADTTSDLDALPEMIRRAYTGADLVLASWVMVNVSHFRRILSEGAAKVINRILGVEAKTVASFDRVYRASTLRAAAARYGDALIREPGFACKAELLSKLSSMSVRIEEVDVGLDTPSGRYSKMPVLKDDLPLLRLMPPAPGPRP